MSYEHWIEELCIVHCIDWDHDKPEKTIRNLLTTAEEMVLDPAISKDAVALIEKYGGTYPLKEDA